MGKAFACFSIALHNFKKWAVNPRLYILLLMEVLYLHSRLSPVGELCARTGYKVTPYLLPFLLDEMVELAAAKGLFDRVETL